MYEKTAVPFFGTAVFLYFHIQWINSTLVGKERRKGLKEVFAIGYSRISFALIKLGDSLYPYDGRCSKREFCPHVVLLPVYTM